MKRDARLSVGWSAIIALGLAGFGCSSTSKGGTGGTTGAGGVVTTGQGGAGGSGQGGKDGGTDAGQDAAQDAAVLPMCASPAPADQSPCNSNPACTKACGVNISALTQMRAQKPCTCSGSTANNGMWSCPSAAGACIYPTDVDLTCLRVPPVAQLMACPTITADGGTDAGSGLIRPGVTPCQVPQSETCGNVCGSATSTVFSYQDSTGTGKVGYCACITGTYQCASVNEWPTFYN
jgi:hypothetical protein